jgi:hypothetical protein
VTATPPEPESFLSGETGHVAGVRRRVLRSLGDAALDLRARLSGAEQQLSELAEEAPDREVVVLSVYRPDTVCLLGALEELRRSRHRLKLLLGSTGEPLPDLAANTVASALDAGKFQNLNTLWTIGVSGPFDWLFVVDDDVTLPPHFLDRFIAICEHFDLAMAQPAQTLMSHAAWRVTRRRGGSYVRESRFVEIGPVTAFRSDAAIELVPFPDLRYGWGLDLHWAALAAERGWRLGIVDALPVRHEQLPVANSYSHEDAIEEARRFLTGRPFVRSAEAQETIATHRTLTR